MSTLTLEEAAEYLHLGINAARELLDAGVLPGVRLNAKHAVFLRDELDRWLAEESRRQMDERRREYRARSLASFQPSPEG